MVGKPVGIEICKGARALCGAFNGLQIFLNVLTLVVLKFADADPGAQNPKESKNQ